MILSWTLELNLSHSRGSKSRPQTACGGCRTSTAVVFMEKVGHLSVRNATEIACLPLA